MSKVVLSIEDVSKQYRLGTIGTGTISHDLNRWWHTVRGKEDPYAKIGTVNDRALKDGNEYVWALKDINLQIHDGDVVGIIGKNGAGKSTLLKLLSQVTNPTTGVIKVKGRIASLLEVGTGFHPELTGKENIYLNGAILGMTKPEITRKLDEIVDFAGVARYIDTPVKRYSSGMKVRLGFAVAAHLEPEILVVDEVLAVGDAEFQKKCIGKMKDVSNEGRTVLFVSHNMSSIRNLCKSGVVLDNGVISHIGDVNDCVDAYLANEDVSHLVKKASYPDDTSSVFVRSVSLESARLAYPDQIDIHFTLHNSIEISSLYLAVKIEDGKGNVVIFSSTDELENNVMRTLPMGDSNIIATIPGSILKPGRYGITFIVRDSGGIRYHKVERALTFEIVDNETFRGLQGRYRKNAVIGPRVEFKTA